MACMKTLATLAVLVTAAHAADAPSPHAVRGSVERHRREFSTGPSTHSGLVGRALNEGASGARSLERTRGSSAGGGPIAGGGGLKGAEKTHADAGAGRDDAEEGSGEVVGGGTIGGGVVGGVVGGTDARAPAERDREAAAINEKYCKLREVSACRDLAGRYGVGAGVPKSREKAIALLKKVCRIERGTDCENHYLPEEGPLEQSTVPLPPNPPGVWLGFIPYPKARPYCSGNEPADDAYAVHVSRDSPSDVARFYLKRQAKVASGEEAPLLVDGDRLLSVKAVRQREDLPCRGGPLDPAESTEILVIRLRHPFGSAAAPR